MFKKSSAKLLTFILYFLIIRPKFEFCNVQIKVADYRFHIRVAAAVYIEAPALQEPHHSPRHARGFGMRRAGIVKVYHRAYSLRYPPSGASR